MQMRVYVEGSQGSLMALVGGRQDVCWLWSAVGGFGLIFVAAKFEGDGLTDGQEIHLIWECILLRHLAAARIWR